MPLLINTAQLDRLRKDQKNVVVLDATYHLPASGRDAKAEYLASHVAGARFLDFSKFHDQNLEIPNMLLRDEQLLGELIGSLGITNTHKIAIYDNSDLHSSCRAAWMFKVCGHPVNQIFILDGGFEMWKRYGGKVDMGEGILVNKKEYVVNFQADLIKTLAQMKTNLHQPSDQVVDVRPAVRYMGAAEHRPGVRSGHIPGSFSFPYTTMFDSQGMWKPIAKIKKQLEGIGVSLDFPIISCCGSGITAAILDVALDLLNQQPHALYDGSWCEWGADKLFDGEQSLEERPVVTSLDDIEIQHM